MEPKKIRLIECPRDAMQGWKKIIPTDKKIEYLNTLLKVGFDTLDFGSFVSAKAIPQMADTAAVIPRLDLGQTKTRLLAIIANVRGALEACAFHQIYYLGFPFSVSETFQQRNTNSSMNESLQRVEDIQKICRENGKELVVYISMGFGNPYGDPYSEEIVYHWVERMVALDVRIISLADTVGLATPEQVFSITNYLVKKLPGHDVGVHLHSRPEHWKTKIDAALEAGCARFDGALKGVGGCPMAGDELVGNMNSEWLIPYFSEMKRLPAFDETALQQSLRLAADIFSNP